MNTRNIYYDFIRVIAMILVIGVHAVGSIEQCAVTDLAQMEVVILNRLNSFGVPLFFALSGVLLLDKRYDDVWGFYKKRLLRIGVPYLIYAVIYVVYFTGVEQKNMAGVPLAYIIDVLTANVHRTHWFVYSILGLYFVTPFLSKMFHAMSDKEVDVFWMGCFAVMILGYIFPLFGREFGINNVIFNKNPLFWFVGGYCMNRIYNSSKLLNRCFRYRVISILILVGLFVYTHVALFQDIAVIMAMVYNEPKNPKRSYPIVTSLSRSSYSIYLLHAAVISLILQLYDNWEPLFEIKIILIYGVVLLVTYVMCKCIDFVITDRVVRKFNK